MFSEIFYFLFVIFKIIFLKRYILNFLEYVFRERKIIFNLKKGTLVESPDLVRVRNEPGSQGPGCLVGLGLTHEPSLAKPKLSRKEPKLTAPPRVCQTREPSPTRTQA